LTSNPELENSLDQLLNGDVEQLIAAAKEVDESGLLDDPTAGIEFDSVAAAPEPEIEAEAAAEAVAEPAEDVAEADSDDEDFSELSEVADADTIDAIFNC